MSNTSIIILNVFTICCYTAAFFIIAIITNAVTRIYRRHKRRIFLHRRRYLKINKEIRRKFDDMKYRYKSESGKSSNEKRRNVVLKGVFNTPEGNQYMDLVMGR